MKNTAKLKKTNEISQVEKTLIAANRASRETSQLSLSLRNKILKSVAAELVKNSAKIIKENKKDLIQAKKDGLSSAMIDRLVINEQRVKQMADGVKTVASLKDPLGEIRAKWKQPNGLEISKISVPIGTILIIYESRPNVTVECASLCLKSGNSVLLRGGKEAFYSNKVLVSIFEKVLKVNGVSSACVSFVKTTNRAAVDYLLQQDRLLNLVIPRGGKSLIEKVVASSKIPVIKHYQGVCHVYVDKKADLKKAVAIARNAKTQRPGVCNAMETLLVHQSVAAKFLPELANVLQADECEVRGDAITKKHIPWAKKAKKTDYGQEFLDKILAVRVVSNLQQAIEHVQQHGSGHTDAIISEDRKALELFTAQVDSSSIMQNASTRFADGFEYGFGAEIGISTDKIHARGPMGLEGLTSYKYVVKGKGQIRK